MLLFTIYISIVFTIYVLTVFTIIFMFSLSLLVNNFITSDPDLKKMITPSLLTEFYLFIREKDREKDIR